MYGMKLEDVTCLEAWRKNIEECFEDVEPVGIALEDCTGGRDPNLTYYWKQILVSAGWLGLLLMARLCLGDASWH